MNNNPYKTLLILGIGMLMAIVITTAAFIILKINEGVEMSTRSNEPLIVAGIVVGMITIPAGLFFYRTQLTKAKQKNTEEEKLTAYRSLFIIRSAIWEMGMFFNLIVFYMLSSWVPLFIAGGIWMMFITHLPTEIKVKNDLEL